MDSLKKKKKNKKRPRNITGLSNTRGKNSIPFTFYNILKTLIIQIFELVTARYSRSTS